MRVIVVEEEVNSVSVVPVQEKNTSECVDECVDETVCEGECV